MNLTHIFLVCLLLFCACAPFVKAESTTAIADAETKEDFIKRLKRDNSPPLSEQEIDEMLKVMLISKPDQIINDPKYGRVVIPGKKSDRLKIERAFMSMKLDKLCGGSKSCRSAAERCVATNGYVENNKIKADLHRCINSIQ